MLVLGKQIDPRSILAPPDFKTGWRRIKTDWYHADKSAVNSTSLKEATKSERAFALAFWGPRKEPTDAMKFGTIVHMAILEPLKFKERFIIEPVFQGLTQDGRMSERSKAAKIARQEWLDDLPKKSVVVTAEEQERIFNMVDSVLSHQTAFGLLKNAEPELIGYWSKELPDQDDIEPEKRLRIGLRMMGDLVGVGMGLLSDLKTCQDCEASAFGKNHIEKLQHHLQMAVYSDGAEHIEKIPITHRAWIAVESTGAFETAVHESEIDDDFDRIGKWQYNENLKKIKNIILNDKYRAAQEMSVRIEPSSYIKNKYKLKGCILNGE